MWYFQKSTKKTHQRIMHMFSALVIFKGPGLRTKTETTQDERLEKFDAFAWLQLWILKKMTTVLSESLLRNADASSGFFPIVGAVVDDAS